MATVITDPSMSLDGFIALPSDEVGPLFDWYNNGDVALQAPDGMTFHVSEASARHPRDLQASNWRCERELCSWPATA